MSRSHIALLLSAAGLLLAATAHPATVASVQLCRDIIEPGTVPVDISTQFDTESGAIHGVAVVDDVVRGTRIKGTWVAVDAIDVPNYEIGSHEIAIESAGQARAHFSISRPDEGWPPGNYRLDVYVDGQQQAASTFRINEAEAPQGSWASRRSSPAPAPAAAKPVRGDVAPEPLGDDIQVLAPPAEDLPGAGFSGRYTMVSEDATLTLALEEDESGNLTGTLSSSSGMEFSIEGVVDEEGVASGICYSDDMGSYFEAHLDGSQLSFYLIESGEDGEPNYDAVSELAFTRSGGAGASQGRPRGQTPSGDGGSTPSARGAAATTGGEEVRDASWGFSFQAPAGWTHLQDTWGAMLGHHTIPGLVVVTPHEAESFEELVQDMQEGISEGSTQLYLVTDLEYVGDDAIAGEYEGTFEGQEVRCRGVGTFSPYGGGAYVVAATTPEQFGDPLREVADAIAADLAYFQPVAPPPAQRSASGGSSSGDSYVPMALPSVSTSTDTFIDDSAGWPGGAYQNPSSSYYQPSYYDD